MASVQNAPNFEENKWTSLVVDRQHGRGREKCHVLLTMSTNQADGVLRMWELIFILLQWPLLLIETLVVPKDPLRDR